jgi:hypothetical protein
MFMYPLNGRYRNKYSEPTVDLCQGDPSLGPQEAKRLLKIDFHSLTNIHVNHIKCQGCLQARILSMSKNTNHQNRADVSSSRY